MDQFYNRKKSKVEVAYHKETTNKPPRNKKTSITSESYGKRAERSSRIERHVDHSSAGSSVWKNSGAITENTLPSGIDKELLRQQRRSESALYGMQVCLAIFAKRPESIVKAYFLQKNTPQFSKALSWMAAQRKSYHVVDESEMQRVTGTKHHEGVCFIIKKRAPLSLTTYLAQSSNHARELAILLNGEQNPYNVGAVIRSAAFFNPNAAMIADPNFSLDNGIVARIASGAAEGLRPVLMDEIEFSIQALLEQDYQIIALNNLQGESVKEAVQQRHDYSPKMAVLLGLLPESFLMHPQCRCINLGKEYGASLNIANLFTIIATEWWRAAK